MDNKFKGEVAIKLGEKDCKLVYNWEAIATLQDEHGEEILRNISTVRSPKIITSLLLTGLKFHHPEITAAEINEISPPLFPTMAAISRALTYAYFGNQDPVTAGADDEVEKPKNNKKKI